MILSIKKFNEMDLIQFAEFSGDFNQIHLDPNYVSRTPYEKPIVHGIHILLYSLECLAPKVVKSIKKCRVIFNKSVQVDQEISIEWDVTTNSLSVKDKNSKVLVKIFDILFQENMLQKFSDTAPPYQNQKILPQETDISNLTINSKTSYKYNGNSNLCEILYPVLTKLYGVNTLCEIAKLSAFVGMKIPGKYSLFKGVSIEMNNSKKPNQLFKISSIDERVGAVSIEYTGVAIKAQIKAFFRPKPINIPNCSEISQSVNPAIKFENISVLIIGGSRGIGAWASKIFAIFGFNVTITYSKNHLEAVNIQNDITTNGGKCRIIEYDVLTSPISLWQKHKFEYVLYFATPPIVANYSGAFDNELYNKFRKFYVDAFEKLVLELSPRCKKFFYPSTTLIDSPELGFEEYIKAKTKGEKICEYHNEDKKNDIIIRRLPRLSTDQNNWIFGKNTISPKAEVIKILELLTTS